MLKSLQPNSCWLLMWFFFGVSFCQNTFVAVRCCWNFFNYWLFEDKTQTSMTDVENFISLSYIKHAVRFFKPTIARRLICKTSSLKCPCVNLNLASTGRTSILLTLHAMLSFFFFLLFPVSVSSTMMTTTTEESAALQPYFDFDVPRNLTVTVGQTGFLHCRVERLGDKDVSICIWRWCSE